MKLSWTAVNKNIKLAKNISSPPQKKVWLFCNFQSSENLVLMTL